MNNKVVPEVLHNPVVIMQTQGTSVSGAEISRGAFTDAGKTPALAHKRWLVISVPMRSIAYFTAPMEHDDTSAGPDLT